MKTLTDVFKNSEKVFEMRGFLICFADRPFREGFYYRGNIIYFELYHLIKDPCLIKEERLTQKWNDRNSPFLCILLKNEIVVKSNLVH